MAEKIKNVLASKSWLAIVVATIALCIVLSILSPVFLTFSNIKNVFVQSSISGIMAVGMTFIILTSGIDISVGAILFFTASLFAQMLQNNINIFVVFAVSIISATLLGALNGYLIMKSNMPPMIATLATYTAYRGLALNITDAGNIPVPREIGFIGNGEVLGIPFPIVLFVVIILVGSYLLNQTRFGLYVKAVGNSAKSANENKLPINKVLLVVYGIGGLTASLAALIFIARIGGLQSGMGIGMEFTVIAAVVLGGTKLLGGKGSIIGSVIGAIFLVLIDNGLNLISASPFVYDVVKGVILLVAVAIDKLSLIRQTKEQLEQKAKRIRSYC